MHLRREGWLGAGPPCFDVGAEACANRDKTEEVGGIAWDFPLYRGVLAVKDEGAAPSPPWPAVFDP